MSKKILACLASVLILVTFGLSVFADGSGLGDFDGLGDYSAFHQGYQVIQSNGYWTNIWSFDNTFTEYDGINPRYKISSINYTLDGLEYPLSTYVYPPEYEVLGGNLRQQHYLDLTTDTTLRFNSFVPYFTNLNAYTVSALGTFNCDVTLNYAYIDGYEIKRDTITWAYENVNSVNILNGLGGDFLYIENLEVVLYGGYMWDWLNIDCPIGVDGASSIGEIPYDLYAEYEVVDDNIALMGIFSWVDDFFSIEIFGTFSLGDMLGVFVGFLAVVWLLKIVAGG